MNFTFMIYILIAILIFIYFDKNIQISNAYYLLGLFIILVLNEIYNFNEYEVTDRFASSQPVIDYSSYYFDEKINPHKHYNHTYDSIEIPYDPILACKPQKKILEKNIQLQKLKLQETYPNKIFKLIEGKPITLNKRDESVFNRIPLTDFEKDKNCPTLCHIIDDTEECDNAQYIPHFKDKYKLEDWVIRKEKCETKDSTSCQHDKDCMYDSELSKCTSKDSMKACISKTVNDKLSCRTHCSYLEVPGDEKLSKLNCENATFSDNTRYCKWEEDKCIDSTLYDSSNDSPSYSGYGHS